MRLPQILSILLFQFITFPLFSQSEKPPLKITHLTGDFYVYTTYNLYNGYQVPANGLYMLTKEGAVMFDTPWDTTQFQPLLDSIEVRHHQKVVMAFATHWHSDKTNGLEYYRQLGIKTYTTAQTDELSRINGKKRAEFLMPKDTVFTVGGYTFETYFPGEGHTVDNIVVWFPTEKILFGGCLIKGAKDKSLGYLGDANTEAYETTLRNVQKRYRKPKFIVIAHSDWKNKRSLKHSIHMAKALRKP